MRLVRLGVASSLKQLSLPVSFFGTIIRLIRATIFLRYIFERFHTFVFVIAKWITNRLLQQLFNLF